MSLFKPFDGYGEIGSYSSLEQHDLAKLQKHAEPDKAYT